MAWTYNNTLTPGVLTPGVLTSTGATEASPDSLLAGIAIVQAADAARGYRNGFVGWLLDVEVRYGGSAIIIDDDSLISMRGSAYLRPVNGAGTTTAVVIIHGNRSVFQIAGAVSRIDQAISFPAGSTVICRRAKPQDPSPRIRHMGTVRNDYFSAAANIDLAKIDIAGVDIYLSSGSNNFKAYFARTGGTVNIVQYKDVRVFGGVSPQLFNSTYQDWYLESMSLESEDASSQLCTMLRPTYYRPTPTAFGSNIRQSRFVIINPTFLNNAWSQACAFNSDDTRATSSLSIFYSYLNTFRSGLAAIAGVNVRFTRARQSVIGAAAWTAPDAVLTAASNAQGTYTAVNLLDAYRAGTSPTDLERFNWTAKARLYDKRTAGETIFTNRVLYQHSVNMSAGYSEEVQMLDVANLTLTQAQAAALTGISFAASGATGGTITVTEPRTTAEVWAAYRNWVSQTLNFDREDSWTFDGLTLNTGAWNVLGTGTVTGNIKTTGVVTAPIAGLYTSSAGSSAQLALTGLTAGSAIYVANGAGVQQAYVASSGTSYTLNILPGATGTWVYRVARFGFQTASSSFTPGIGGVFGGNVTLLPDAFVTDTLTNVQAYTDLNSAAKIYDYLSLYGTTNPGIIAGSVASKGFGTLTVPTGLTLAPAAADLIAINGGLTVKCSGLAEDVTVISSSTFTQGAATLTNTVKIRASNFDSELIFVANAITLYPTQGDRDAGTNPGPTSSTGIIRFKFGATVQGVLMQGTEFARVDVGVTLFTEFGLASGANLLDLGVAGQLAALNAKVDTKPTLAQMTAGGIALEASVQTRASQVSVDAIPPNPLLTTDTRLNNLDAAISTRSTLTAPQVRTELATELGRIDVAVSTRLATSAYTAPTTPPTAADNAAAVRTNLATELGRIDVATSTRLATAGYTAPANADIAAIKAKTDTLVNGPTLANIEASTVLAKQSGFTGLATATNVTNAQTAIVGEINANETKIDAVMADTAAINAKTATLINAPTKEQIRAELEATGSKLHRAMKAAQSAEDQTV